MINTGLKHKSKFYHKKIINYHTKIKRRIASLCRSHIILIKQGYPLERFQTF
jgi:hypothetical protein